MTDPLLFTLAALALLLTPGPTNTLLALAGAIGGLRRSLLLLPAELCGYLISIHVIGLGVGQLAQAMPTAQAVLRLLCSLCLLIIGARLWFAAAQSSPAGPVTPGRVFIVTLLNPKALVFALAIVPALSTGHWRAALPYLIGLSFLIAGAGSGWVALGAAGGRLMRPGPLLTRRIGGMILLFFAALLALSAMALLR